MNWFDNVSSDSDQPIAAACLVQGHWRHALHPYAEPVLCRVVLDLAEPRVVAAQAIDHGTVTDLGSSELEDLTQALMAQEVHHQPKAWGFAPCTMLPVWARPSFSESQLEELERIDGYLIEASEETIEDVLRLREQFLRGIGMTDQHILTATRSPEQGPVCRKGGRLVN
ncbi:hypothetical protein GTZ97_00295 [Aquabacterium fontiphilum]|jgi:hypothetical protein|uniref:hypothetical protein n=1 Tax=Aquabacterium fontiphilum TaxID=450365 RepID=UPI001378B521|nr:hypothetical protein [Aquabacterium fontiphilum]NBD19108.1 hypothetical protein [Aquabacterium fontiphilum]